jgi:N-acetyl-anhydromuramyl-L-alanine amidase AmpD
MANGLAYHFVIGNGRDSGDGEIEIGNRWVNQLQGGHVSTHQVNELGIGICLVGNFEELAPSTAQISALTELVLYLKNTLHGGRPQFMVHREVDGNRTLCPGRHFPTARMHRIFA